MRMLRSLAVAGVTLLAACATPGEVAEIQEALEAGPGQSGSAFTHAAFLEYQAYARHEAVEEGEWSHAVPFARKAMACRSGQTVAPDQVTDWPVPEQRLPELNQARARLMAALDKGARQNAPALAAKAQANFDCWLEEEAEGETASACRDHFLLAMGQMEPPPAPAPVARVKRSFVILFDFDSAALSVEALNILAQATAAQAESHPDAIQVEGHTDTRGAAAYNRALAEKRAQAAAEALTRMGVQARLDVKVQGEAKPALPTGDDVKEGRNRRVEITFE